MARTVGFFTDTTLCIGCKACEVACKEWNRLPGHVPTFGDGYDNTGKLVHQVGMPWHWGWEGVSTGAVVNTLTSMVGDPNVSIHEGKAFVCNVEKD